MIVRAKYTKTGDVMVWFEDGAFALAKKDGAYDVQLKEFEENGGEIEPFETDDDIKRRRYRSLERVFAEKAIALKKIAIDKPWMIDKASIEEQYNTYNEMYKNALAGRYDEDTNAAIIEAHEAAEAALAPVVLLMNDVRSAIEKMIENGDEHTDEMINAAANVTIPDTGVTDEWIAQIREEFGL